MDEMTVQKYSEIMNKIIDETGGEYSKMNLKQKLIVIHIMQQIDKQMTEYINKQLPIVRAWASLDISDVILSEKECHIDFDNVYVNL